MEKQAYENYNAFVTSQGNIIWAAGMQLAWNELREKFTHNKPIALHTENQSALQMINNFNNGAFKRGDISQSSIYVKSGYGMETINLINKEVKAKFPKKQLPQIKGPAKSQDIISFAYIWKQVMFEVKFQRRKEKTFLFNQKPVESFFATNQKQKKQVICHQYEDSKNFHVQIKGVGRKDSILLIKSANKLSVDEVIQKACKFINGQGQLLKKGDIFQMPVIKLQMERVYKQLLGLGLKNTELAGYFIGEMFEGVNIQIDESGAKVQNQAVIKLLRSRTLKVESQKTIILDSSFWIVMKETNKHPYLCLFIQSPTSL